MDIRQLRYFIAIAEAGSFTAAARILGMAQPPLSVQMKLLETELETPLFDRSHRSATLTPAGIRLLPHAKRIVEQTLRAGDEIRDGAAGRSGLLRLGITPGARSPFVSRRLRKFIRRHRGVRLDLTILPDRPVSHPEPLDAIITQEIRGEADGIFLTSAPVGFAIPKKHRLAGRESINPADLLGETIFLASEDRSAPLDQAIVTLLTGPGFHFDAARRSLDDRLWLVSLELGLAPCLADDVERSGFSGEFHLLAGPAVDLVTLLRPHPASDAVALPLLTEFLKA